MQLSNSCYALSCADGSLIPVYSGSWYTGVTMPTDRMRIYYNPEALPNGLNINPFFHSFGSTRQLNWCAGVGHCYGAPARASILQSDISLAAPVTSSTGTPIVCFKRIPSKGACPEGGINPDSLTKVCGYAAQTTTKDCNTSSNAWLSSWDKAKFGCVHEPLAPAPPPFNVTLLSSLSATVTQFPAADAVSRLGSSFLKPVVQISDGTNYATLTYDYTNIDPTTNFPRLDCKVITDPSGNALINTRYCAEVPQNDPGNICVCPMGSCAHSNPSNIPSYIGCTPRPTPQQSNIKMVAFSDTSSSNPPQVTVKFLYSNHNGDLCLRGSGGLTPAFCSDGTLITHVADSAFTPLWSSDYIVPYVNPAYKHSYLNGTSIFNANANMNNLAAAPYIQRLGMPPTQKFYKEYYLSTLSDAASQPFIFDQVSISDYTLPPVDTATAYSMYETNAFFDLQFMPYIANPESPVILIQEAVPSGMGACSMPQLRTFANTPLSDYYSTTLPHLQYSAERNRLNVVINNQLVEQKCMPMYFTAWQYCGATSNTTPLPLNPTSIPGAYQIETSFCPGLFVKSDVEHKICFIPTNINWPALNNEVFNGTYHDLCATVPAFTSTSDAAKTSGCKGERESLSSNYVAWPYLAANQSANGTCNANLGLEQQKYYYIGLGNGVSDQSCPVTCRSSYPNGTLAQMQCLSECPQQLTQVNYCDSKCGSNTSCQAGCTLGSYNTFTQAIKALQNSLAARNDLAASESRNLLSTEISTFNSTVDSLNIGSATPLIKWEAYDMPIKKFCTISSVPQRSGGCVYKNDATSGCGTLTSTERFLGYMLWNTPISTDTLNLSPADNFGLQSKIIASPTNKTCKLISTNTTKTESQDSIRYCKVYFKSGAVVGKVWLDVDLSQSGVADCIGTSYSN